MKKEKYFNKIEEEILKVLYQQRIPLSAYEIAKDAKISYPTAKKYTTKLLNEGILSERDKPLKPLKRRQSLKKFLTRYQFKFEILEGEKPRKRRKA